MNIHTKNANEKVKDIAERYGIPEDYLRKLNELETGESAEGEELLLLVPTRSYNVQYGDTVERIAIRFGVSTAEIYSQNPWLRLRDLKVGECISVKQPAKKYGMGAANGYYYKECSREKLLMTMPFLTYITFAGGVADERGVFHTGNYSSEVELAHRENKIPLIRIYDRHKKRYKEEKNSEEFAKRAIDVAIDGGYKGIVLDACHLSDSAEEFISFLMILRKMMIGCDLILITEVNENSPSEFSEYADGSVFYYPKYAIDNPPCFDDGERRVLGDYACQGESAKTFIDLPSFARQGKEYLNIGDALKIARESGCNISKNENTLLSHFSAGKQGECIFSSPELIKSIYELASEYDYMGISFDIMRTPLMHIMMYNSMFKTSFYSNVRTREGCSRVGEE